ncbi:unnamed protein product [Zymoseptoria tritici ST99CH_3D7]|uniref:Major facilitator superfamily (MFS) profile domain-containing protein n=1 Tax=Zymoseptoria tritici (strain ST99CH_3D7) TaxID=1276538 RepID=A0A1X7RJQ8_ZYMT9|nr:unnamed protein product [Zymoseptoria tritici ST99CH_3D7]
MIGAGAIRVGIVIVATAHSFAQVVGGMALSGAGAGIGELTALSGVGELVPVKKRGLFVGLVVACLIPTTPYVMYSQLFSSRTDPQAYQGWRWGQWISLIYNGVALVGIALTYFPERNSPISRRPRSEVLREIDYVGAFLSISGVALFLVALQSGGLTHPWTSDVVLATLIIGIFLIIGFCVWEWKFAKTPMIPRELFSGQRIVAITFAISFISGMNFYSLINFFPATFSSLYNPDPIQVGLKGLGYGISVTAGAASVNALMTYLPKYNRELLLGSCVLMTAFIGALATATPDNARQTVALGTIGGFGVGGVLVPAQTIAMTACPDHLIGTVVSLALAIRVIGGSIGYSIYFNIFKNKLTAALPTYIAGKAVAPGLPATSAVQFVTAFLTAPATAAKVEGVTAQVIAAAGRGAQEANAHAFYYVWVTSIAFGLVSVLLCMALPSNYKFLTNRVAAHIKH